MKRSLSIRSRSLLTLALAVVLVAAARGGTARGEDLQEAWGVALRVNQQLQAQQQQTVAAGFNVQAAQSARYVSVRSINVDAFLFRGTTSGGAGSGSKPTNNNNGNNAGGNGAAAGALLNSGQTFVPISLTQAQIPIYTGGRLVKTVDSNKALLGAQRSTEFRTAIDLKLTVAEAYVAILRAQKNLETARSNVEQLASFARDVRNRLDQGLAIRSDDLAAQVSLANAELNEVTSRTALESAWATYNRYLCRPLDTMVALEEITRIPGDVNWEELASQAVRNRGEFAGLNSPEVGDLTARALRTRPELANLAEQARSFSAQADATRAALRPQVTASSGFAYLGVNGIGQQSLGTANFLVDWQPIDSGRTRRQTEALRAQARSALKQKADTAADVALQVRTRWLDLQTSRQRVPIARFAVTQADENVKVITDRYRQQLATYTEVLDAETRRITSLNNFYNAIYDENLADFRLRRAVGEI